MLAEVGIPLLAALFLEINALILGLMIAAFFIHEATALWDVSYAVSKRWVSPLEQHVHSFLEMLPLMAICIVSLTHSSQWMALFGFGSEHAHFTVAFKADRLPVNYLAGFLFCATVFNVLPYLNELWRGMKAKNEVASAKQ